MKFRSLFFSAMCALAISTAMTSCSNDDDDTTPEPQPQPTVETRLVGFLNEGGQGKNNANMAIFERGNWTNNLGAKAFGYLGDVANDVITTSDNEFFATVSNSKLLAIGSFEYSKETVRQHCSTYELDYQPRYLVEKDKNIYISCYGGYIIKWDKDEKTIASTLKLEGGENIEGMAIVGNTLYVCNSYSVDASYNYTYYDELLTVDLTTFKQGKSIKTVVNPNYLTVVGGKLYVIGFGNYGDVPYQLASVENGTSKVLTNASKMCEWNGNLLFCYSETDWSNYPETKTVTTINLLKSSTGDIVLTPLTDMPEELNSATIYMMQEDPESHEIYLSTSDYTTNSTIYRFDATGKFVDKFDSNGINCNKAIFLKKNI